ncbi:uncharacterized protein (TIGR04222 family) [Kibdelosporangium banguiense]|uniref:Uncharacterized protein (TIGR04222 family) n=1 Tax=Kibdelosporangium banguiense TaxID=1365924 RepID=A0ABS4U2G7_9PSEU|nr:TIGR04222 domain-containing membrane protein [Kibdelosporangium banguiense]MBP2330853.1 uncharacterized protein (TIGR04222 family) [Kibdelosporangium banguiense]
MNHPWGISGPAFIWLYIGAFGLALVALLVMRRVRRSGSIGRTGSEPLTVEETAYLSGGWPRMVESAIAGLVSRNVIRVQRTGYIYKVSGTDHRPESELEELVVGAVDGRAGQTVGQIQRKLAGDPMFDRVLSSLEERGLAYRGGRAWAWLSTAPLLVLFAVGAVRWVNGVNLGFPVVYLGLLLILTLVVIIFAVQPVKPGITKAGRKVLAERGSSAGTAALVAVGGLGAYPDRDTARVLRKRHRDRGSDSGGATVAFWGASSFPDSASGGVSSGCGGSSGGGGCGGGGGGGCGGGGS